MSKITEQMIAESEKFVSELLAEKLPEKFIFHNFNHALKVKHYAETIGKEAGIDEDGLNAIRIAALFHDTGYLNSIENHSEESVKIASAFLTDRNFDQLTIDRIAGIISANRQLQEPKDKLAEVLCDADLMFIACEGGLEQLDLLYDETSLINPNTKKRSAFEKDFIDRLNKHSYFTDYGKTVLQPAKEAALLRLSERMKRRKTLEVKKESEPRKSIAYSRGVDTMFRITARNQINLNSIADNKSNILISVNAIIISIIITMLAGNIGNMSNDIVPILILLVSCLVTIIIAILSTRPNLVTRKFTGEDIKHKKVDLTFFGNFIRMKYDDYEDSIKEMMTDDEYLYSTLLKNQYELGKILAKKFRLVRIAYNAFMIGIIVTVIAFILNYVILGRMAG